MYTGLPLPTFVQKKGGGVRLSGVCAVNKRNKVSDICINVFYRYRGNSQILSSKS